MRTILDELCNDLVIIVSKMVHAHHLRLCRDYFMNNGKLSYRYNYRNISYADYCFLLHGMINGPISKCKYVLPKRYFYTSGLNHPCKYIGIRMITYSH